MYFTNILPDKVLLSSDTSIVEIWPQQGAILNSWRINMDGGFVDVIEGYDDADDFKANAESKGFRSVKLSPYVCRMQNSHYTYDGSDYSIGKFFLNGTAIHGLVYNEPFEIISQESNDSLAMVVLRYRYRATDAGYPFTYELTVTYTLTAGNSLTLSSTVKNTFNKHIPIADGWHPYFSLGASINQLQLQVASNTQVAFNEDLVPTGELLPDERFVQPALLADTQLDNCFLLKKPLMGPACILVNPNTGIQLSIWPDDNYPYLQLYIPPHRKSIAIENLSAAPDAFNNKMGLIELDPGEMHSFTTKYIVQV